MGFLHRENPGRRATRTLSAPMPTSRLEKCRRLKSWRLGYDVRPNKMKEAGWPRQRSKKCIRRGAYEHLMAAEQLHKSMPKLISLLRRSKGASFEDRRTWRLFRTIAFCHNAEAVAIKQMAIQMLREAGVLGGVSCALSPTGSASRPDRSANPNPSDSPDKAGRPLVPSTRSCYNDRN